MSELDRYDYELPPELIAQHPLPHRADARLMVVDRRRQAWETRHVRDLPELLEPGDCLVLNDTRVLLARLVGFRTETGGRWQGLFLEEAQGAWKVLGKTRGHLRVGESITLTDRYARPGVRLLVLAHLGEGMWAVRPETGEPLLELLDRFGRVPLPPYIRGGEMRDDDVARYQTVFARRPGSVAAPTAGLHFTPELLESLRRRGVDVAQVTLHVGVGTFRPVTAARLDQHTMHSEWGEITGETVERLRACRAAGGRIVAVGTTSVRVLETAANGGELAAWSGNTTLFIRPPFRFAATHALVTNFHLPRSTLLVLVSTLAGRELILRAYQAAVEQRYRFFSYGDAMLIL